MQDVQSATHKVITENGKLYVREAAKQPKLIEGKRYDVLFSDDENVSIECRIKMIDGVLSVLRPHEDGSVTGRSHLPRPTWRLRALQEGGQHVS